MVAAVYVIDSSAIISDFSILSLRISTCAQGSAIQIIDTHCIPCYGY